MKARIIFAIAAALLATSCGTKLFDQETVEKSRNGAMVTVTFNAGGADGEDAAWESDGKSVRTVRGVIGTPLSVDNPALSGHMLIGWAANGGKPGAVTAFPEEDTEYTGVWEKSVVAIRLSGYRLGLAAGKTGSVTATCLPKYKNSTPLLSWASDNEGVATVDENGVITAAAGATLGQTANVTVASLSGIEATLQVIIAKDMEDIGAYRTLSASEYTSPRGEGVYVAFGSFPQTVKAEGVEIFGELANDEHPGYYATMKQGGLTYYLGTDYEWYAKETMPSEKKLSDDKQYNLGEILYFKVEPIYWKVLTTNYSDANGSVGKLLFSETTLRGRMPYYESSSVRKLDGNDIYVTNYKYSNIRAYLNGTRNQFDIDRKDGRNDSERGGADVNWKGKGLLQTAFTPNQQEKIKTTMVDNSKSSLLRTNDTRLNTEYVDSITLSCENTEDKIFLLSINEATRTEYGFDQTGYMLVGSNPSNYSPNQPYKSDGNVSGSVARTVKQTDYAWTTGGVGSYFYRSPGNKNGMLSCILYTENNILYGANRWANEPSIYNKAIVPALCVD